ncbi:MAG: glycosyltransferase [Alphaproteobacteria bacterium]
MHGRDPTFRRPERLRAAIASVRAQAGMDPSDYEILIVDNSPEGSAAGIVKAFPVDGPASRYVHETEAVRRTRIPRAVAEARGNTRVP